MMTTFEICNAIYSCKQKHEGDLDLAKSEFLESYGPCESVDCDQMFSVFDQAFKAGVNSVITCGASTPKNLTSLDPLWVEAFHYGARVFKRLSTPMPIKILKWAGVVLALAAVGYLIANAAS